MTCHLKQSSTSFFSDMTADKHYINLYRTMMLQIRRSVVRGGIVVNAKPIFILSLIDCIRLGMKTPNAFPYDEALQEVYRNKWNSFYPNVSATPICKPYYHLTNDGFWSIKWKNGKIEPPSTDKKLRENVEYGCLDNALWDVLQVEETRQYFENQIISYFLSDTK